MAKTYKELSEKLDSLLAQLQDGSVDLDAAVDKYAQAAKLIDDIKRHLEKAQVKIKKIEAHTEK